MWSDIWDSASSFFYAVAFPRQDVVSAVGTSGCGGAKSRMFRPFWSSKRTITCCRLACCDFVVLIPKGSFGGAVVGVFLVYLLVAGRLMSQNHNILT
jgi:hypothetical protein